MRFWVSILMVLAWLGYGFMPALAVQTRQAIMVSGAEMTQSHEMGQAAHGDHRGGRKAGMSLPEDCSQCGGMTHAASCPGCLATVPDMRTAPAFTMPFRYPAPWRGERLTARAYAPPTPPPRA